MLFRSPSGGSSVAKGSSVDLVVAAQGGTTVPDVTGSDKSTARSKLESLGFNVSTSEVESTQPAGIVVDQDPGGTTQVPAGSTVTIYVSTGSSSGGGSSGGGSSGGIVRDIPLMAAFATSERPKFAAAAVIDTRAALGHHRQRPIHSRGIPHVSQTTLRRLPGVSQRPFPQ